MKQWLRSSPNSDTIPQTQKALRTPKEENARKLYLGHNILKLQKTKEKTLKEARVKNTSSTEKQKQELHPMPPKPCKEEDGVKYLEVERKKPKHLWNYPSKMKEKWTFSDTSKNWGNLLPTDLTRNVKSLEGKSERQNPHKGRAKRKCEGKIKPFIIINWSNSLFKIMITVHVIRYI